MRGDNQTDYQREPKFNQKTKRLQLPNGKCCWITQCQMEVFLLIVTGKANKVIASDLGVSIKTVEKHRQQVMVKTNLHSVVELVHFSLHSGMVKNIFSNEPTQ